MFFNIILWLHVRKLRNNTHRTFFRRICLSFNIKIKELIRQLSEHSVTFEDGTVENNIDAIVYGTGHSLQFPFLKMKNFEAASDGKSYLYKFVFPPSVEPPTLAFIGFIVATGALMPVSECTLGYSGHQGRTGF